MRPVLLTTTDASGGATRSATCPMDVRQAPFQVTISAIVTGTANYDVQYTKDDVWSPTFNPLTANWISVTGMAAATASAEATLISPVTAIRVVQNSGNGSMAVRIIQGGQ